MAPWDETSLEATAPLLDDEHGVHAAPPVAGQPAEQEVATGPQVPGAGGDLPGGRDRHPVHRTVQPPAAAVLLDAQVVCVLASVVELYLDRPSRHGDAGGPERPLLGEHQQVGRRSVAGA